MLCDIAHIRSVGLSDMCYPFASSPDRFDEMLSESTKKQPFKKLGDDIVKGTIYVCDLSVTLGDKPACYHDRDYQKERPFFRAMNA